MVRWWARLNWWHLSRAFASVSLSKTKTWRPWRAMLVQLTESHSSSQDQRAPKTSTLSRTRSIVMTDFSQTLQVGTSASLLQISAQPLQCNCLKSSQRFQSKTSFCQRSRFWTSLTMWFTKSCKSCRQIQVQDQASLCAVQSASSQLYVELITSDIWTLWSVGLAQ